MFTFLDFTRMGHFFEKNIKIHFFSFYGNNKWDDNDSITFFCEINNEVGIRLDVRLYIFFFFSKTLSLRHSVFIEFGRVQTLQTLYSIRMPERDSALHFSKCDKTYFTCTNKWHSNICITIR